MDLRRNHPNFWLFAIGAAVSLGWIGAGQLFVTNTSPSWRFIDSIIPLRLCGVGYLTASVLIAVGLRNARAFYVGIAIGVSLALFFATALLFTIIADLIANGTTQGTGGPALYGFLASSLLAASREPRSNPDARR